MAGEKNKEMWQDAATYHIREVLSDIANGDDVNDPLALKKVLCQWIAKADNPEQTAMRSFDASLVFAALLYLDIQRAIGEAQ